MIHYDVEYLIRNYYLIDFYLTVCISFVEILHCFIILEAYMQLYKDEFTSQHSSAWVSVCWSRSWAMQITAIPVEMSVRWVTSVEDPRNHVLDEVKIPQRMGQFCGLCSPLKNVVSHCCGVCSIKINNSNSVNPAADCISPDWPVSH